MGHWPCDKLSNVSTNQWLRRVVSQTVKNLLRKAEALRQDPFLALLTYRTTPVDSNLPSPHLLNHRGYRTKLPCSSHLQSSQAFNSHREQLQNRQNTERNQYDRQSTHELRRLNQGEQVAVFQPQTKTWIPAEMKEETGKPRSYIVKTTGGSELRHNRVPVEDKLLATKRIHCQTAMRQSPYLFRWHHQNYPKRLSSHWYLPTKAMISCLWQPGVAAL